jgi:lipid-A-disaccharide synthase
VSLVNLVSQTRAVPECIGKECNAQNIASKLLKLMEDTGGQPAAMAKTMRLLGQGGEDPGLRAAKALLAGLNPAV